MSEELKNRGEELTEQEPEAIHLYQQPYDCPPVNDKRAATKVECRALREQCRRGTKSDSNCCKSVA